MLQDQKLYSVCILLGWECPELPHSRVNYSFLICVTFSSFLQKKMCGEQKFDNKKADGTILSNTKSVKGSHHMSICANTNLKSGKNIKLYVLCYVNLLHPLQKLCCFWTAVSVGLFL